MHTSAPCCPPGSCAFSRARVQVCEKQRNMDLAEALRDVNENRLSKFELALLLSKMIDDVTLEEVQFNFVEHFYSDWCAEEKHRLDHVPTEPADDADPAFLSRSTAPMDKATMTGEEGEYGGGSHLTTPRFLADDVEACMADEMLYLYP